MDFERANNWYIETESAISQVVIGQCIMSSVNIALKLQEKQGIHLAPPLLISTALKYSLVCFGRNRKSDNLSPSFCGLHAMNQANMDGPYMDGWMDWSSQL